MSLIKQGLVYLHCDFDKFDGFFMGQATDELLKHYRMVPATAISYFFTVNGEP